MPSDLTPPGDPNTLPPLPCVEPVACPLPGQETFAEVYESHVRLMRLIAVRDFRVPFADAESIVHDIFMHYFSNPGVVRGELKPYFRGAVRNECLEYWRKRQREQTVFCDVDVESESAADETLMSDTIAVRLAMAETLARLRPRCRDALRCFHYEGKSMRDVAAELDVAPLYVRQLLHHCRKAARVIFESIRFAAVTAVVAVIVVQPVLAAAKTPQSGSSLGSLIRKIIRALDTIDIRLPPG